MVLRVHKLSCYQHSGYAPTSTTSVLLRVQFDTHSSYLSQLSELVLGQIPFLSHVEETEGPLQPLSAIWRIILQKKKKNSKKKKKKSISKKMGLGT